MPILPYAPISDIREAILRHLLITFTYCGKSYTVEPHEIITHPRTGAFELVAWVTEFPDGEAPDWRRFRYSYMRGMDRLQKKFGPRHWVRKPPVVATRPYSKAERTFSGSKAEAALKLRNRRIVASYTNHEDGGV